MNTTNCSLGGASRVGGGGGVGNDTELNVRDEVREEDEEFFQQDQPGEEEEGEGGQNGGGGGGQEREEGDWGPGSGSSHFMGTNNEQDREQRYDMEDFDKENDEDGGGVIATIEPHISHHIPSSIASSRHFASNLSKIIETDEFSFKQGENAVQMLNRNQEDLRRQQVMTESTDDFSFKQGENAVQMLNRDQEELRRQQALRLHSFHNSQNYSFKHSWEESALRHQQNSSFLGGMLGRTELDLSQVEAPVLDHQQSHHSTIANSPPFLTGSRHIVYFGFCRPDFESYQDLVLRNIHHEHRRVHISCEWVKGSKHFLVVQPAESAKCGLNWDCGLRVVIGFTPPDVNYYRNTLRVQCKAADGENREYFFMIHGYGGRAVVDPVLPDRYRSASLHFSANGQYQLVVRSVTKFRFSLQNIGTRSAFASLFFYQPNGAEVPEHEVMVNMHNLLLAKPDSPDPSTKMIEVRYLGGKQSSSSPAPAADRQSVASGSPSDAAGCREIALRISIIWSEEKQRQRLKQFEKREAHHLRSELRNFGHNFTQKRNFHGETVQLLEERHISEEDYYCFDRQCRITHINIIERAQVAAAGASSMPPPSSYTHQRSGSALSVVSGGTATAAVRRELRAHQTIVEMDPDNTLTGGGGDMGAEEDDLQDTLT